MNKLIVGAAVVALLSVSSCRPEDQTTESVDPHAGVSSRAEMPVGVPEALDSGSVAYSAGDYEKAGRHYREAARLGPEEAAAWFGVYMVEDALGNQAAADSALERVRELAPGATLLHPTDSAGSP